jgi:hypothetical protein
MSETKDPLAIMPIQSLDQFAGLLTAWHAEKVRVLEHMLTIPEDTTMQLDGGPEVTMTADIMTGFRAGIQLSLMELGTLPFITESRDAEPATADAANDAPTEG